MKEHPDPESCADHREVGCEALTGAPAGWVLSREMDVQSGSRRCQRKRKAIGRKPHTQGDATLRGKPAMHAVGESDGGVVPTNVPNKGPQGTAEGREGRPPIEENRTQSRVIGSRGLDGVREAAAAV